MTAIGPLKYRCMLYVSGTYIKLYGRLESPKCEGKHASFHWSHSKQLLPVILELSHMNHSQPFKQLNVFHFAACDQLEYFSFRPRRVFRQANNMSGRYGLPYFFIFYIRRWRTLFLQRSAKMGTASVPVLLGVLFMATSVRTFIPGGRVSCSQPSDVAWSVYDFSMEDILQTRVQNLSDYRGEILLIVNTATY